MRAARQWAAAWALLSGALLAPAAAAEGPVLSDMVTVVHLHSTLSDGAAPPLDLARGARAAGVDAIVVTDHYLERMSYAPWPIGNAFGVALSRPSVVALGTDRYLAELARAERQTPGVLVVPGVEASPYARFSGSLLAGTLELHDWHRHLLVLGIEDASALARLPAAGNRRGGTYNAWSLLFAVPAMALAWSARRVWRPSDLQIRIGGFRLRRRRRPKGALLVGIAALVPLVLGYPFRVERFSPVGPDPGAAPYAALVDSVRSLGGASSWAHPEARDEGELRGVRLLTPPYPDLIRATGADAFGALPEGTRRLLPPGGIWDGALADYLAGRRARPTFALAELDEHHALAAIDFGILQTVFQVRERTHAGLIQALQAGRLYARWTPAGRPPLTLPVWRLAGDGRVASSGESLASSRGSIAIRLAVAGGGGEVTARLVRGGAVIWSRRAAPPFEAEVQDDPPRPAFYRLDVEGAYPYRLIANPIFVGGPQEAA